MGKGIELLKYIYRSGKDGMIMNWTLKRDEPLKTFRMFYNPCFYSTILIIILAVISGTKQTLGQGIHNKLARLIQPITWLMSTERTPKVSKKRSYFCSENLQSEVDRMQVTVVIFEPRDIKMWEEKQWICSV